VEVVGRLSINTPLLDALQVPTYLRTMCGSRTGGWSLPGVMID
jgi:hypothetical protein